MSRYLNFILVGFLNLRGLNMRTSNCLINLQINLTLAENISSSIVILVIYLSESFYGWFYLLASKEDKKIIIYERQNYLRGPFILRSFKWFLERWCLYFGNSPSIFGCQFFWAFPWFLTLFLIFNDRVCWFWSCNLHMTHPLT